MDAKEFKAWFEGFCEGVGEAPTAEQWAKLKQKAGTLAGPLDNLNLPNAPIYRGDLVRVDEVMADAARAKPSCQARVVNDR